MKTKAGLIVGIVIALLLFGFLLWKGVQNSAAYYYTLAELDNPDRIGEHLRVKGMLVKESVVWEPEIPRLHFSITDGTRVVEMVYDRVRPDHFEHSTEVIVEGSLMAENHFKVSKLMLQCPSKYETEHSKGGDAWLPLGRWHYMLP